MYVQVEREGNRTRSRVTSWGDSSCTVVNRVIPSDVTNHSYLHFPGKVIEAARA